MAILTLNQNILTAPGVYLGESTRGIAPIELAPFNRCYMLGSSTDGEYAEPKLVVNAVDAANQFGVLPAHINARAIDLFFRNYPMGLLFYVRVPIGALWTVKITGTPVAGDEIDIVLDPIGLNIPVAYNVSLAAEADMAVLLRELTDAINRSVDIAKVAIAEALDPVAQTFNLRLINASTQAPAGYFDVASTSTANVTIEFVTATAIYPSAHDFVWTIKEAFDPDMHDQGFIIAPEAFHYLRKQGDRVAVGQAMSDLASSEGFDWVALIDSGPHNVIATNDDALAEGRLYNAPFGHAAYYWPHLIDTTQQEIPPSPAIAALALRRYAAQGFQEPPAGTQFPIRGVVDVKFRAKRQHQAILNPEGINVIRYMPNIGVVAYGARSLSRSPYYRFINTRVILNVLTGTLREAFNNSLFTAIDGSGILFTRLRGSATAILYLLYNGGALYGGSPGDAFYVKVDDENNPSLDLEAGVVRMDIFVTPPPTFERLLVSVSRVAIGQMSVAISGV